MKTIPLICALLGLSLSSSTTLANNLTQTIGIGFELGGSDISSNERFESIDADVGQTYAVYNYNFNKNLSLQANYIDGSSEDFELLFSDLIHDNKVDYKTFAIGLKGALPISSKTNVYAVIGSHRYDYDVINERTDETLASDNGFSLMGELGIEAKLNNGIGASISYRYLKLGSDLQFKTVGFGLSYSF